MRSVLVTGADGFIGAHLVRALSSCDAEVHPVQRGFGDISFMDTWESLPRSDVLIHLAGKSSVLESWENPSEFMQTNCMGISYALEYCRHYQAKLIFLSSYMYGDAGSKAIPESAPILSKNPYALTKQFAEQLCEFYSAHYQVESRILRPFNVYGPFQDRAFLIPKIVHEALTLGKVYVKDLEPRRDYVYVDDIVSAIIRLMDYVGPHRIFNIGTGRSYSVLDVINTVQALLQHPVEIANENVRRPGEIMDSVANIGLAERELGWVPKFNLSEGLSQIIAQL